MKEEREKKKTEKRLEYSHMPGGMWVYFKGTVNQFFKGNIMKDFNAIINAVTRATHNEDAEIEAIRALAENGETYASICRYFENSNSVYVIYKKGVAVRIIYNFDSQAYDDIETYLKFLIDDLDYNEDNILDNIDIFDVTSIKFMTDAEIKDYTEEIDEDSLECVDVQMRRGQLFLNFEDANGRSLEECYEYDSIETKKGSVLDLSDNYKSLSKVVAYDKSYSAREYADKLLKFFEKKRVLNYVIKKMREESHQMFKNYYNYGDDRDVILMSIRIYSQNMKYAYKIFAKSGADLTPHFAKLLDEKLSKNGEIYDSGFGMCRRFVLKNDIKNKIGIDVHVEGVTTKNSSRVLQDLNAQTFKHIGLA